MNISARTKQLIEQIAAPKITLKKVATPTYSAIDSVPAEDARAEFDRVFDAFLGVTEEWNKQFEPDDDEEQEGDEFSDFGEEHAEAKPPPVHAACVSTGTGKTQRAAAKIARFIQDGKLKPGWSVLYLVPRHELGEHIDDLFLDLGVTAQVYRGRRADDPNIPGNMDLPKDERTKMCIDLESLSRAEKCGKDITKACCKHKKQQCKFYDDGCGYQKQHHSEKPQVWICAHEMLHYAQKWFGKIAFIVIDESFWKRGVYGVETRGDETRGISLEDMELGRVVYRVSGSQQIVETDMEAKAFVSPRHKLIEVLQKHPLGGLEHKRISKVITPELCKYMIGDEWDTVNRLKLTPQMSPAQIKHVEKVIPVVRTARRMVGVWGALRELVGDPKIKVSGRLILDENDAGQRVLKVRGVKPVRKSRQVPTFIMDATLPHISILQAWFPQVKIVADIDVVMPEHVTITQIVSAPVSKHRLFRWRKKEPKDGARNLKALRRLALQWWIQHGRKLMLLITQQAIEDWLIENADGVPLIRHEDAEKQFKKTGTLPDGIVVAHYNNISGLDRYKVVGSQLLIGRTIPWPAQIEAYAGALTGEEPTTKMPAGKWYPRVERAIRMKDGTGRLVERCDQHPDDVCEHVRFQICEGELLQSLGRVRAINRTAQNPVAIGIVTDVVLPITADTAAHWEAPSKAMEPAEEGVMLFSAHDMVEFWPWVWKSIQAANRTLAKIRASARAAEEHRSEMVYKNPYIPFSNGVAALYQRAGRNQKLRRAAFDLAKWPSPRAWFDEKRKVIAALLQLWEPGDIEPMAGNGKVHVDESRVTVLKRVWETLEQLFDRAAKNPWRKLPKNQPTPQFVCEAVDPEAPPAPHICPAGQLGRMNYKSVAQRKAEGTYCVWPLPAEPPVKAA
jgi:putative DNA primase/helicase